MNGKTVIGFGLEGSPKIFISDDNGDLCDLPARCHCKLELVAAISEGLCLHPVIPDCKCTNGRNPV